MHTCVFACVCDVDRGGHFLGLGSPETCLAAFVMLRFFYGRVVPMCRALQSLLAMSVADGTLAVVQKCTAILFDMCMCHVSCYLT